MKMNIYDYAKRIYSNIRLTSDNIENQDCYWLCANKQLIDELRSRDHQVIWGRRGTGKTTLLKAFVYDMNRVRYDPENIALYIMMARMIPTNEEIKMVTADGSSVAVYIFSKMVGEICHQLADIFDARANAISDKQETDFMEVYFQLVEYIQLYQTQVQGSEITISNAQSEETTKETGNNLEIGVKPTLGILGGCFEFLKRHNKGYKASNSFAVSGKIVFNLETQKIAECLSKLLDSMDISNVFLCLDEYSEIDKCSIPTLQRQVGQLIKQVFFKNERFTVKIATIWNRSKLHERGGNRVWGIEYKQDIFAGPDLDIMFMEHNIDVTSYFKDLLVNTYLMDEEIDCTERERLADYFESDIFGVPGLRHLICGSQGVSRSFVILVKEYLQEFIKNKRKAKQLDVIYELIRHQYLEDVRNKIPYYTVYKDINAFISKKLCRYFLIAREDYQRCKEMIQYLATRGVFMQMPGHLTDRSIRDEYKLFIINYGNYLDALESESHKMGRKALTEDATLRENGLLIPEYNNDLLETPEKYTVSLSPNAETEFYCMDCHQIFQNTSKEKQQICPVCGREIQRFEEFLDEVSL